jgi:hypothetical protein
LVFFFFFIFSFRKQHVEGGSAVCAALRYEGTSKRNYDKKIIFSEAKFNGEEELDLARCSIMGQMSWGFRQAMSSQPLAAVGGFKPMKLVQ